MRETLLCSAAGRKRKERGCTLQDGSLHAPGTRGPRTVGLLTLLRLGGTVQFACGIAAGREQNERYEAAERETEEGQEGVGEQC
mmetsp:Transcript_73108/g.152683  ORF Transcript_73108/g.152683 Transcript_73108/m.152683 type:complete len:84 (+) Transcript_73108:119-370(+)